MAFGAQGRLGVIVPANNSTLEPEFWPRLPQGVASYATRVMAKGDLTLDAVRRMIEDVVRAADELAATGVDIILFADMVTTIIMDAGWNERETGALELRTGIRCISAWTAMRDALAGLNIRRLALGTPYPREIHALASAFFEERGFIVVEAHTLDILSMREVPRVTPERLREFVDGLNLGRAETLVLLATDLPTFAAIEQIERHIDRAVLSSNQTLLWNALRRVGNRTTVEGLGRLFTI